LNWHWRVAQVLIIGGFVKWRNPGNIVTLEGDVRLEPNRFSNASPADTGGERGFSIG